MYSKNEKKKKVQRLIVQNCYGSFMVLLDPDSCLSVPSSRLLLYTRLLLELQSLKNSLKTLFSAIPGNSASSAHCLHLLSEYPGALLWLGASLPQPKCSSDPSSIFLNQTLDKAGGQTHVLHLLPPSTPLKHQ